MSSQGQLGHQYPGGCFIGFNASIERKGVEQLLYLAGQAVAQKFSQITVCLSSTGGDPESAIYAYNLLTALPIKLVMHNTGAVQSAAVTVFLAASKENRFASRDTTFFFHQTSWPYDGRRLTEARLAERVISVKRDDDRTAQIIANQTGSTIESVYEWQKLETTMNSDAAKAAGLISAVRDLVIPQNALFQHAIV